MPARKRPKSKSATAKKSGGTPPGGPSDQAEGSLRFAVDAGLLFQLGEELVNRRSVALAELIKNAYDADATRLLLRFDGVTEAGGRITVADNGTGMSFKRIQQSWMRIATPEKVEEPTSRRFKRPRAGAKGVGRFAARRLARSLDLISVALVDAKSPQGPRERTTVRFDWAEFKPGLLVDAVPVHFSRQIVEARDADTGVTLILRNVREAWSEEDIADLQNDLLRLISPVRDRLVLESAGIRQTPASRRKPSAQRDPGFHLVIEAPEFPSFEGALGERFLANALAVLEGTLTKDGRARFALRFRERKKKLRFVAKTRFALVGPASFTVHYFSYRKEFFEDLEINLREAQTLGRERGGVHIYVDRFRVAPYGDAGDDWLNLDEDRARRLIAAPDEIAHFGRKVARPMLLLPGNNQLFGSVFLSRFRNPHLQQTVNRERFIENRAFRELREFVRLGINWLTVCYAREFASTRQASARAGKDPAKIIRGVQERLSAAAGDLTPEQQTELGQALGLAQAAIAERQEEVIGELSMLRVLASTGTMIVVFDHQLLATLASLRDSHMELAKAARRLSMSDRSRVERELERIRQWIDDTEHQGELLGLLIGRKARSKRSRVAIRPAAQAIADAFTAYRRDLGIEFDNGVPAGLRTPPMYPAELSAILINLFTNALKAVRFSGDRSIRVDGGRQKGVVSIRVSDTGVGAPRRKWEQFFRPFHGESEPDPLLGQGTGLGLKIVRDFVEVYGGNARFVHPQSPWRTTIEVILPEKRSEASQLNPAASIE